MSLESIISSSWCTGISHFSLKSVYPHWGEGDLGNNPTYQYSHSHSFLPLQHKKTEEANTSLAWDFHSQVGYGERGVLPQSGESLTGRGGKGPLEKALSNLSSKQGYLQGAAQRCVQSDAEYLQGPRLHSALRFHREQEGGSSLLYKVHPENEREIPDKALDFHWGLWLRKVSPGRSVQTFALPGPHWAKRNCLWTMVVAERWLSVWLWAGLPSRDELTPWWHGLQVRHAG